jgi:hypothetical protein
MGDLNRDGHLDVVTSAAINGTTTVHLGDGLGNLVKLVEMPGLTSSTWPVSLSLGDVNGDGTLDLAVANFSTPTVTVLLGQGDGTFGQGTAHVTGSGPVGVVLADMNRDGQLDLVVSHGGSNSIGVYPGMGDGSFGPRRETPVGIAPTGLAVADLNLDGILDVAVTNSRSRTVSVLRGIGNGFFDPWPVISLSGAVSVSAGDFDSDGFQDLVVPNFNGLVHVLRGGGDGTFTPAADITAPSALQPQFAAVYDRNADGKLDLAVADGAGVSYVVHGNGDGTFAVPVLFPFQVAFFGVATGDLNEDGFPDLATVADAATVGRIFLNEEGGIGGAIARGFPPNSRGTIALGKAGSDVCLRLEPVDASYENSDVDFTSVQLTSEGTGNVDVITAVLAKSVQEGDTDRNGVAEIPICFTRSDLGELFAEIHGRQTVTGRLRGSLIDGREFCTAVELEIVGTGAPLAASVSPNPLNPRATLRFSTSRDGAVKIRMYDLHGRVVRTLLERALVPAGFHEVEIDGRSSNGQTLASGIYFYEVKVAEGSFRGRLTVLK